MLSILGLAVCGVLAVAGFVRWRKWMIDDAFRHRGQP